VPWIDLDQYIGGAMKQAPNSVRRKEQVCKNRLALPVVLNGKPSQFHDALTDHAQGVDEFWVRFVSDKPIFPV
jgi:hypothetical protein